MTGFRLGLALLAAAIAGGVAGAWIGKTWHAPATQASAAPPDAASAQAQPSALPATIYTDPPIVHDEELGAEVARAQSDPVYLRDLMRRFEAETDPDKRGAILSILQSAANDDVLRMARQLLTATDAAKRQDGLALLRAYPLDKPEARTLMVEQLQRETNPAALRELVGMLTPAIMSTDDAAPVVERLTALRHHPDPEVRAGSVSQTMQWDKSGDLEGVLYEALLDPAPQVRQAAIGGIGVSSVRSPRVKELLLDILGNPQADREERTAALFTLQNFPLDRAEYEIYRQASLANSNSDGAPPTP
ncbi:HEAT repeat domain-containing protein [Luteimonas aquatica]|uniref:HEAT repeat domain-containing protein n=1 Tax=Luteimonas aquatica TaxID=450364 RepID=UPI001F5601B0|nr:HEAT repeat domain-containing protein [Luteimonas aquatica]